MTKYLKLAALVSAVALAACSLAPHYEVPETPVAAQYQTQGPWTVASPADQLDRAGWWKLYKEPELDDLEQRLIANNPDLSAALFHYEQSQAYIRQVKSQMYPQVSAAGNVQRERESDTRPLRSPTGPTDYNSATLGVEVDYEVDLWGRVRDSVAASKDEGQASKADLASTQLSLEIELARSYIDLRGLDQQIQLIEGTQDAYQKALDLTRNRHGAGIVSGLDVARASNQLSSVQSELTQVRARRALLEHAVAVLVGASPSEFQLAPSTESITLPVIPVGVPSTLLQRRPDVAAAERRIAAANSKIGVARAAYFPTLTLSAQGGVQSSVLGNLLSLSSSYWAIGPSLAVYLLDGGKRHAQLDSAKEATAEAGARYRSVVLGSFRQVEDNLTLLDDLGTATNQQQDAASAAQTALNLALARYQRGAVSYLDVVEAQSAQLEAQRSVIALRTRQLDANVDLIHALGGGWTTDDLKAG
ncbi:efflux transporter outer membrane subunit [Paraburkholderia sp. CNPSo 3281]|uniref:efflux transporter outer membrane subunit n=1 Tax=Paraburkholderia sp. CNPSo 3281 TaxID=2940933 RepID=UPI0020B6B060|nr:efflux transporter outer membrane subunit [Paraburkholderia sp. CNPSo 3281]MCP3715899.1 efflux transporter outer membrane subunit [Paraburkholderia sp. CNPSo 3281]